eukprot:8069824-Ditylum_brightwellii.AAC.1
MRSCMARPPPEPPPLHSNGTHPLQGLSILQTSQIRNSNTDRDIPMEKQAPHPKKKAKIGWKR